MCSKRKLVTLYDMNAGGLPGAKKQKKASAGVDLPDDVWCHILVSSTCSKQPSLFSAVFNFVSKL